MHRTLLASASLLALALPAMAQAQTTTLPAMAVSGETAPGTFMVFFGLNRATLGPEARRVVTEAAEAYRRTGSAQVSVSGYADTTGSASYNQRLSERRAEAVRAELARQGVPAASVSTVADGENDLLVPTADQVREPRNRRVQIVVPQPAPPPAPVAEAMPAAPAPMVAGTAESEPPKNSPFSFTVGPVYGYNFKEQDKGSTSSSLAGVELRFDALPGWLGGVVLKQDLLWAFQTDDDGLAGRTVASLDFAPNLGVFRPHLSLNGGGVYGNGVQTGLVAGPEIGFDLNLYKGLTLKANVAYDYQFRNSGLDDGILWGGLNLGIRF